MTKYYELDEYYDDLDEEETGPRKGKPHHKKQKSKFKGHQDKYGRNDARKRQVFFDEVYSNMKNIKWEETRKKVTQRIVTPPTKIYDKNVYTLEVKPGVMVDFSRLSEIIPIQQNYEGLTTYGIKYIYSNNKGYRLVWYNKNKQLRDKVLEEKTAYWQRVLSTLS